MSGKNNRIYIGCLILIILYISLHCNYSIEPVDTETKTPTLKTQGETIFYEVNIKSVLTPHENIVILNDEDFVAYGFPGDGTLSNPYRIENYDITTSFGIGVYIYNTTKNFLVSNCLVSAIDYGIVITDIISGDIIIENNTCANHNFEGIYVWNSTNIKITENVCYENRNGIRADHADYLEIMNNYCYDNGGSIYLIHVSHALISDNTMLNGGIRISYVEYSIIERNVVVNYDYSGIDMSWGGHNRIVSNYCTKGVFGIITEGTQNVTILENECSENNQDGIFSRNTDDSVILNNYCTRNNESGIRIVTSLNISVTENICTENKNTGIYTYYDSTTIAIPPIIKDNYCRNNTIGIRIWKTYSARITNNTIESNEHGILLVDSKYTEIDNNILLKNRMYGIKIELYSSSNVIYTNYFLCNNLNGTEEGNSQAYDAGHNDWYNEETNVGNYYSDYTGEGEYQIDGKYERTDPYPQLYEYCCYDNKKTMSLSILSTITFLLAYLGVIDIYRRKQ